VAPRISQKSVILIASDKDVRRISTSKSATNPHLHPCLPRGNLQPRSLLSSDSAPAPPCNLPQIARYCVRLENSSTIHLRIGPPTIWVGLARRLAPQTPAFRALLRSLPPVTRRVRGPRSGSHRLLSAHAHGNPPRAAMASGHSRAESPSSLMCLRSLRSAQRETFTRRRIFQHPRP